MLHSTKYARLPLQVDSLNPRDTWDRNYTAKATEGLGQSPAAVLSWKRAAWRADALVLLLSRPLSMWSTACDADSCIEFPLCG